MSTKKLQNRRRCIEVTEEDNVAEFPWTQKPNAATLSSGKYQCRNCGESFETLEAHDYHYRKEHGQSQPYLTEANQS